MLYNQPIEDMLLFSPKSRYLSILTILISFFFQNTHACDRSELQLDSVVQVGNEYDIYLTTFIGAGVSGAISGAENDTRTFVHALYTACTDSIVISSFTPTITSDTLGCTMTGFTTSNLFGAQGILGYMDTFGSCPNGFSCVISTAICGLVHTQVTPIRMRVDVIPDSIVVLGLEGNGNPLGGCFPDPDCRVDLSSVQSTLNYNCCNLGDSIAPEITCPPNVNTNDCGGIASWPPPVVIENCGAYTETSTAQSGDIFQLGITPVSYIVTDTSGNSDSCSFTVNVVLQALLDSLSSPVDSFGYQVSCSGDSSGSIAAFPSGGCPPFNYLWNTGATSGAISGQPAGIYWVEVTDNNGQVRRDSIELLGPPALSMFLVAGPDTVCPGDSATALLSLSGGVGSGLEICVFPQGSSTAISCQPAQGGSSTIGPLAAGSYLIEGKDANGCLTTLNLDVVEEVAPTINLGQDTTVCTGTSLTLDAGPGTSYLWNTGATTQTISVSTAGTYFVETTNSLGCNASDSLVISIRPLPMAQYSEVLAGNLSYQFTDLSQGAPTSYFWDFGDGNTSTLANPLHTYGTAGNYTVCLTTTNACGTDSICMQYTLTGSTPFDPEVALLSVFPNPGNGLFWLEVSRQLRGKVKVKIFDSSGRVVEAKTLVGVNPAQPAMLDLGHLPNGNYWLRYEAGDEVVFVKILKEQ